MSHAALIAPIKEWLIDQSLGKCDIVELFETMCIRMTAVGIPIRRARLIWPTLHPLFQAETVIWDNGEPARLEQFLHQDQASEAWNNSPLKYAIDNGLSVLRRQLEGENELVDFELTQELKEAGFTDYLLLATELLGTSFRKREGENNRGILVTWASDKPGGFSNDDLNSLQSIQRRFAVAAKTIIQSRISENIAHTYLGVRAGDNVLNGQIRHGDGEKTRAVVWYSDLRNSTSLAETLEPDEYFSLLNSYFDATAEPVQEFGGEVLDFIGDAVLGIFPFENDTELKNAVCAANNALSRTIQKANENNELRAKEGLERFNYGVALNAGDVMFGNIGIPSRLTFSAIGPTVNEAARIEQMTKLLQRTALAGKDIAQIAPDNWTSVGSHKLEGMLDPVELFAFTGT